MIISLEVYNEIVCKIQNHKGNSEELEEVLSLKYQLPKSTVLSIISNENKKKMKRTHYKMSNMTGKLFERYINLKKQGEDSKIMLKIANEIDVPYSFLAKIILEKLYDPDESGSKLTSIKQFLKDTTILKEGYLAYEVYLCQLYDSQYGSINDIIRHSLGLEYEYHLQKIICNKDLTFQSECDLRIYGYDKTPDIKLDIPFAVDGFIVNWIESKALFADPEEHQNYMNEQYSSYWNRFGTGLVIYWLGMVDTVIDPSEKRFIVRYDFPSEITVMDPLSIVNRPVVVDVEQKEKPGS